MDKEEKIPLEFLTNLQRAQLLHCRPELRYDKQTEKELADLKALRESSKIKG